VADLPCAALAGASALQKLSFEGSPLELSFDEAHFLATHLPALTSLKLGQFDRTQVDPRAVLYIKSMRPGLQVGYRGAGGFHIHNETVLGPEGGAQLAVDWGQNGPFCLHWPATPAWDALQNQLAGLHPQ